MSEAPASTCYTPRPAQSLPILRFDGWTLKPYRIFGRPDPFSTLDPATLAAIHAALPQPALALRRPGLAFAIEHLATPLDYIILCWWDNNNEMITRIFIREAGTPWRLTRGNESFCVWDLDIMWFERNAFVKHMLASTPDSASYLNSRFEKSTAG